MAFFNVDNNPFAGYPSFSYWQHPGNTGAAREVMSYGRVLCYAPNSQFAVIVSNGHQVVVASLLSPVQIGQSYRINYASGAYFIGDKMPVKAL